ncbi:MAG: GNAT family protein [Bacteroidota bacterium]
MSWIQPPVILESKNIKLVPLDANHFPDLISIGANKEIWAHLPADGSDAHTLLHELKSAVLKRVSGSEYPLTIFDNQQHKIIGSTRLLNIFPEHRKLEIGWTWYDPAYWGTGYNTECKLLLLTYCFETLGTVRVQLQTREQNFRSQAAIKKIGATFEGILRNDRIRTDGTKNTFMFSIIDSEWPAVKANLEKMIASAT